MQSPERLPETRQVPSPSAPSRRRRYGSFALRIGVGVALLALLLWHFNAGNIVHVLTRERPLLFIATIALYLAGQAMSSWRWELLAGVLRVYGRFREFLAYYFIGVFTNLFVPGLVGGDAARAYYLGRRHARMSDAIGSVVMDRGIGLVALCWLAAGATVALKGAAMPREVATAVVLLGAALLVGYLLSPLLARLIVYLPRLIARPVRVIAPYLHRPSTLVPAIILSLILQISLAICQYLLALGLGLHISLWLFLVYVPIANFFAAIPITLNGLGIRETMYLFLFGLAGVGRTDAIAMGLLWFAATMLGGLTGAFAFITTPVPQTRAGIPENA